jgi:hypothetical protein
MMARLPGYEAAASFSHSKMTPDLNPNVRLQEDLRNQHFLRSENGFVPKLLPVRPV